VSIRRRSDDDDDDDDDGVSQSAEDSGCSQLLRSRQTPHISTERNPKDPQSLGESAEITSTPATPPTLTPTITHRHPGKIGK